MIKNEVLNTRISRRATLRWGLALATATLIGCKETSEPSQVVNKIDEQYYGKVTKGFSDQYEIAVSGNLTITGNCVAITIHRPNHSSGVIETITQSNNRNGSITIPVTNGDTLQVSPAPDHTLLNYNFSVSP